MLKYEEQTSRILKACMEVHNELGNGFLEPVYQEALEVGLLVNFGETSLKWERISKFTEDQNN